MTNLLCLLLSLAPFVVSKGRWSNLAVYVTSASIILLGRYLSLENSYISVDEAQILTQAKLLLQGHLPWIHWDPTTSGPLNSLWPNLLNFITNKPTLMGGRILSILLQWISLVFLYNGLRIMSSAAVAWALTLPALYCFSLNGFSTLSGMHTGVLPGLFFTLSFYFTERANQSDFSTPRTTAFLFAGAQWMTKLQAAPAALIFTLSSMWKNKVFSLYSILIFLTPTLLIVGTVTFAGGFEDFWNSYVIGNIYYGSGTNLKVPGLMVALWQSAQFPVFLVLLFLLIASAKRISLRNPYHIQLIILILSILPSRAFLIHYIDILLFPLLIATASAAASFLEKRLFLRSFVGALLSLSVIWQVAYPKQKVFTSDQFVSQAIEDFIPPWRPAEIALWGWMPEVFVLTETTPGTRDTITQFALFPHPRQDYYVERFITDLEKNKPLWFLDVACREPKIRKSCGLENHPRLEGYLKENYVPMEYYKNPVPGTSGLWKRR